MLPLLARIETPRPVPNSIADDVLAKTGSKATPMVSTVIAIMVAGGLLVGARKMRRPKIIRFTSIGEWSFSGPFGKFDRGAVQRGLKVYKEVCASCHSLSFIAFRNLAYRRSRLFGGAGCGLRL